MNEKTINAHIQSKKKVGWVTLPFYLSVFLKLVCYVWTCISMHVFTCTSLIPQLDYLDLYLIHWPRDLTKDCLFPKVEIKPEEILGYSAESISQCWEVCACMLCMCVCCVCVYVCMLCMLCMCVCAHVVCVHVCKFA